VQRPIKLVPTHRLVETADGLLLKVARGCKHNYHGVRIALPLDKTWFILKMF
jgi:hypothetical protein